jgi:dinuclear metal center YbgI/SA1388 family protein
MAEPRSVADRHGPLRHHLLGDRQVRVGVAVVLIGDVHVVAGPHVIADDDLQMADDATPLADQASITHGDHRVAHHPLPFRPVERITGDTGTGRVLLELIHAGCGVWSSHTAWDSATGGINDQLAALLKLAHVSPIEPDTELTLAGFGRAGSAADGATVADLSRSIAAALCVTAVQIVGDPQRPAGRVGIVCGSGGGSIAAVRRSGCQTLLTGELKLHEALEAEAAGLAVVAVGHHASEHFAMKTFADKLATGSDFEPLLHLLEQAGGRAPPQFIPCRPQLRRIDHGGGQKVWQ